MPLDVFLRPVEQADLATFYQDQLDPEGLAMAAVDSRDREAFTAHWARITTDDSITIRTVVCNGMVVGNIASWPMGAERFIGYWLGRAHWGQGIATAAVRELLAAEPVRPLLARVAKHNLASLRVLQKCGFEIKGEEPYTLADGRSGEKHVLELDLRRELRAMAADDRRTRDGLAADGTLEDGYDPRMEAVHRRNAARLAVVLEQQGWPGASLVGPEAAEAAWLIAQHAIGEPDFQRRSLRLLQEAAAQGEVPAWQPAMLEDRIRMFEGRRQLYGTQLEPDDEGRVQPYPIEDPEHVEERRVAVGLEPLAAVLARAGRGPRPRDPERFKEAWLRRVGWRRQE